MEPHRKTSPRSRRRSRHPRAEAPLCACGCGKPTRRAVKYSPTYDLQPGEYYEYIQGHDKRHYVVDDESGCWVWCRAVSVQCNGSLYGCLNVAGGTRSAHRYYYEQEYGPVPPGLELDHAICGNTLCVRPAHMQAVDHRTNVRRGRSTKLSAADVAHIRTAYAEGEKVKDLAQQYGVTGRRIYDLLTGKDRDKRFYDPTGPVDPTRTSDEVDTSVEPDLGAAA